MIFEVKAENEFCATAELHNDKLLMQNWQLPAQSIDLLHFCKNTTRFNCWWSQKWASRSTPYIWPILNILMLTPMFAFSN